MANHQAPCGRKVFRLGASSNPGGLLKPRAVGGGQEQVAMSEFNLDPLTLPVLPLRNIVVFPHMVVPLFVGRDKTVRALEEAMGADKNILLVTQRNENEDEPTPETIYDVGVVAHILQLLKLPDVTVKVLVEGKARAAVL